MSSGLFSVVRASGKLSGGEFSARTGPSVRDGTQCASIGRARLADPRQVDCAKRKTEEVLVAVEDKREPGNGIFWAACTETRTPRAAA